ncbi:MAG: hypothetical protein GY847_28235 [Proteobacteria bacterium]|nr:hypothetical protein [Pseudomonadota bacterium]
MSRRDVVPPIVTIALCAFVFLSCKISTELWIEGSGEGHGRILIEDIPNAEFDESGFKLDDELRDLLNERFENMTKAPKSDYSSGHATNHVENRTQVEQVDRTSKTQEPCEELEKDKDSPFIGLEVTNTEQPSDDSLLCQFTWVALKQEEIAGGYYRVDFSRFLLDEKGPEKEGDIFHTLTIHVDGVIDEKVSTGAMRAGKTIAYGPGVLNRILVYRELSPAERILGGLRDPVWSGIAGIMAVLTVLLTIKQLGRKRQ